MALGTTGANIITWLKAEIGDATGVSTANDTAYLYQINDTLKRLAALRDWPQLAYTADVSVSSQYTALPTTINFDRPVRVQRYYNGDYIDILYGIGPNEYNLYGPTNTADPIEKWQMYPDTTNAIPKFEVWPVPTSAQTVRFFGQYKFADLANSADSKCFLDDMLVIYTVASDILSEHKAANAPMMVSKARERLAQLGLSWPIESVTVNLSGRYDSRRIRHITKET